MSANKVVVHYKNGKILKGTTADFLPKKSLFHLNVGGIQSGDVREVFVNDLKAIFFVKDFSGDKQYTEIKGFGNLPGSGKRVKATFADGESVVGYTHIINFGQPGFFLVPTDPKGNNERIYTVFSSLTRLEIDGTPVDLKNITRV